MCPVFRTIGLIKAVLKPHKLAHFIQTSMSFNAMGTGCKLLVYKASCNVSSHINAAFRKSSLCLMWGDSSIVGANQPGFCPQVNFQYDLGLLKVEASGFIVHTLWVNDASLITLWYIPCGTTILARCLHHTYLAVRRCLADVFIIHTLWVNDTYPIAL